jgi:hypothetical protein
VKGLLFLDTHDEEDDVACDDDCNDDELRFDIFCLAVSNRWMAGNGLEMDWRIEGIRRESFGFIPYPFSLSNNL